MQFHIFTSEGGQFLLRWFHFLAGITWIGILYYFNFVQTPFFGGADPAVRTGMVRGLVPRALWWFRWGAMVTFLTGWLIVMWRGHTGTSWVSGYMTLILTGGLLGTLMWANVWFVIWPAQKVVIASAEQVAAGGQAIPEAAARGQRAGLASRTNTLFSIPMLFFMGAASHFQSMTDQLNTGQRGVGIYWVVALVIVALIEMNALAKPGKPSQKPLATVKGTITSGFLLAVLLYVVGEVLL